MRRTMLGLIVAGLILALPVAAQRHRLGEVNAETPEGALLQQIGQEPDAAKRLALLNDFTSKFPKHEAYLWVMSEMHTAAVKAGDYDKAAALAEKLIAAEPDDVESAHATLKLAEARKDPDLVVKWAVTTSEAARKAAVAKKPEDEDELELWKRRVDFSKQVDTYTEYAIYAQILQVPDPNKKVELTKVLASRNPNNQYLPQIDIQLFQVYMQQQNMPKALEMAERVLARDPTQEDMLLMAADYYFNQKNYDKASDYSVKLVELMKTKAAPAGMAPADWDKKKERMTGLGLWMQGVGASTQNKFAVADKILREALPVIKENEQLYAAALFHLGLANYRLGDSKKEPNTQRILDALRFNQQCAAIKSPFQAQASRNVAAIKGQYRVQ